ncbi:hypothetical protein OAG24_00540 [bacterium]|nr:hypothetical protein [bacterium]
MAQKDMADCMHDLKQTVVGFVEDIKDNIIKNPTERSNMEKVLIKISCKSEDSIMADVIEHLLPHENKINKQGILFFVDHPDLLQGQLSLKSINESSVSDKETAKDFLESILEYAKVYKTR